MLFVELLVGAAIEIDNIFHFLPFQMHQTPTLIFIISSLIALNDSGEGSLRGVGDRITRDSKNSSTPNFVPGLEPGICLNITRTYYTSYALRKKSSSVHTAKKNCTLVDSLRRDDCHHIDEQYEVVPEVRERKMREPFCCNGYVQVENYTLSSPVKGISRSWPDGEIYCQPVCDPPCLNGSCISPNKCECPNDFILLEDNRTCDKPECNPPCINSDCVGQNTCKCHTGYISEESEPNLCVPYCVNPCLNNSYCYSPNECRCLIGYKRQSSTWKCVPKCNLNCVNGFCSGEHECQCLDGYKKVNGSDTKCEPVCENCEHGECLAPGFCRCNNMYERNLMTGGCSPECSPNCTKGCDAPMQCRGCDEGYTFINGTCEPECEDCMNGGCMAPGVCICNDGYERNVNDTKCIPQCTHKCKNGFCSAPNRCTCLEGFQFITENVCESEAIFCKRDMGYVMEDFPVTDDGCRVLNETIRMYTDSCPRKFDNTSCFQEFCNHPQKIAAEICDEMVYTCEYQSKSRLGPTLYSPMNAAQSDLFCWWRKLKVPSFEVESSNETITANKLISMQDVILPLFFFRTDFDLEPCRLCLCPVNNSRTFCRYQFIDFKICPCEVDEEYSGSLTTLASIFEMGAAETNSSIIGPFIIYGLLPLLSIIIITLVIIAVVKNYRKLKVESQTYSVSAFSNDLYCENKMEEAEHVYAEIEFDGPEEQEFHTQNTILSF